MNDILNQPPTDTMRDWAQGDPFSARHLNEVVAVVRQMITGANPSNQIVTTGIKPTVQRFRVKSVADDHIVCRTWDGKDEGLGDIKVAKPWILRKEPWATSGRTIDGDSVTYDYTDGSEREADNGTTTEEQVIVPRYNEDDEIYAMFGILGDTGVVIDGEELGWLDMNNDGRMWAKKV